MTFDVNLGLVSGIFVANLVIQKFVIKRSLKEAAAIATLAAGLTAIFLAFIP